MNLIYGYFLLSINKNMLNLHIQSWQFDTIEQMGKDLCAYVPASNTGGMS